MKNIIRIPPEVNRRRKEGRMYGVSSREGIDTGVERTDRVEWRRVRLKDRREKMEEAKAYIA